MFPTHARDRSFDGRRLAELMIDFEVGVTMAQTYHVKRVDSDDFDEG
jgi:restriction system protein